jgi:hypothetical protein
VTTFGVVLGLAVLLGTFGTWWVTRRWGLVPIGAAGAAVACVTPGGWLLACCALVVCSQVVDWLDPR